MGCDKRTLVMLLFIALLLALTGLGDSATATCPSGYTLINSKCLRLYTTPATHRSAETTCMGAGATLVTAKNSIDNRAITTIAGSVSLIWMGIYCFGSDPSKCLWDDSTGSAESYSNFASGFPLVEVGKCVYYSTQGTLAGKWLSGDCVHDTRAFICELPHTFADNCTYNYGGHCYSFHSSAPFAQAQMTCEQECGNLASISSANENRYIARYAATYSTTPSFMIGGIWPSVNSFSWIDGSYWDYSNMDPSATHSSYNCLAMSNIRTDSDASGFWFGIPCTSSYIYVCKRPAGIKCNGSPPPVTVTPIPSNPSNCNSSLLFAPGVFTTPNFPNNYDNNVYCVYQLATLGS